MLAIHFGRISRNALANVATRSAIQGVARIPAVHLTNRVVRWNSQSVPNASEKPAKQVTPEQAARKEMFEKMDDLQRDWDGNILSYEDFLPKTQNPSPNAYIVDVREPDEVIQGMIPGAINIPLSVLSGDLNLHHEEFLKKYGFEKPQKTQEITFYCRSGVRSTSAVDVAKRNGWPKEKIMNYKGSWLEWTAKQHEKQ